MAWKPISESKLKIKIDKAISQMTSLQKQYWNSIKIQPEKWKQHPEGDYGNGFWVVALIGRTVIWYNDIEEGFNLSHYSSYGIIDDYRCNQSELELAVQGLLTAMETQNSM